MHKDCMGFTCSTFIDKENVVNETKLKIKLKKHTKTTQKKMYLHCTLLMRNCFGGERMWELHVMYIYPVRSASQNNNDLYS